MKDSISSPLRIDYLVVGARKGRLGITICPGKKQSVGMAGSWDRDLDLDLDAISAWGAGHLVTLMEAEELPVYRVPVEALAEGCRERGLVWHHLPIRDVDVPGPEWEEAWAQGAGEALRRALRDGEGVVVHCRGGLGRSGMVAARLLVELGEMAPEEAIAAVRRVRPGAIETRQQEEVVRRARPVFDASPVEARDRFLGCLLGGAVGDALAAPVEFMKRREILARFGPDGITDYAPAYGGIGRITDDTQMTLFTAEGLIRGWVRGKLKGITSYPGVVAHAYLRWQRTQGESNRHDLEFGDEEPGWLIGHRELHDRRAPGNTCLASLREMRSLGGPARNSSKGCGTVMRIAPVGLFVRSVEGAEATAGTFEVAMEIAAITHGHPTGSLTAGVLAVVIQLLAGGASLEDALRDAKRLLVAQPDHRETLQAIELAEELAGRSGGAELPHEEAIARLGEGWIAEEALAVSIYCALVADDFRHGVVLAANHDGDSDSTAAITGNLLGVRLGVGAIPAEWLQRLELREVIEELATDLLELPQWRIGEYELDEAEQQRVWRKYPGY
ncbi:MAG: hypothetical protein DWQ36_22025 [Acidobacteria bacterium]|nr:MAG: hypothetical protein DWQ36_22025 [Acidobacteriota bacterium]